MISHSESRQHNRYRNSFGLEIDFHKGEGDPSRVFIAMSELIQACQDIDRRLVSSIQVDIKPILILEDIQQGSLIAWIRSTFKISKDTSDLGLDSEKLEEYLNQSKFALIDFTRNKTTITNETLTEIQMKIFEILGDKDPTPQLPIHTPIAKKDLLVGMQHIQTAVMNLDEVNDSGRYIGGDDKKVFFNLDLEITPESIEDILTKDTIVNEITKLLKVKKPDYLGSSQWEFKDDNRSINVKLNDFKWLEKFRNREFVLAPEDSLLANIEETVKIDADNNIISKHYILLEVKEIRPSISRNSAKQLNLDVLEDG